MVIQTPVKIASLFTKAQTKADELGISTSLDSLFDAGGDYHLSISGFAFQVGDTLVDDVQAQIQVKDLVAPTATISDIIFTIDDSNQTASFTVNGTNFDGFWILLKLLMSMIV